MAQQRIAEAQPFMQSAILGRGSLDYRPEAARVGGQIDYSTLDSIINPQQMQFTPVTQAQPTQPTQQASAPVDLMQQAMMQFQTDGQIPL